MVSGKGIREVSLDNWVRDDALRDTLGNDFRKVF